jgi:hypothetical protein
VVSGLFNAWLSDGLLRGERAYSIYFNAIGGIIIGVVLLNWNLYGNVTGTLVLYWFSTVTQNAGPLILSWINEICAADSEKRALLVAMGNDFAYVVQAVAPNFVWKTTEFPQARKGWTWSIVLSALLGESNVQNTIRSLMTSCVDCGRAVPATQRSPKGSSLASNF